MDNHYLNFNLDRVSKQYFESLEDKRVSKEWLNTLKNRIDNYKLILNCGRHVFK